MSNNVFNIELPNQDQIKAQLRALTSTLKLCDAFRMQVSLWEDNGVFNVPHVELSVDILSLLKSANKALSNFKIKNVTVDWRDFQELSLNLETNGYDCYSDCELASSSIDDDDEDDEDDDDDDEDDEDDDDEDDEDDEDEDDDEPVNVSDAKPGMIGR